MKKGNIVKLNSGGPDMTIKGFIGESTNQSTNMIDKGYKMTGHSDGDPYCTWFDNQNKLHTQPFFLHMLTLVK